jgi:hypothetical protein
MVSLSIPAQAAAVFAIVAVISGGSPSAAFLAGQFVGAILFVALVEGVTRATSNAYQRMRGGTDEETT